MVLTAIAGMVAWRLTHAYCSLCVFLWQKVTRAVCFLQHPVRHGGGRVRYSGPGGRELMPRAHRNIHAGTVFVTPAGRAVLAGCGAACEFMQASKNPSLLQVSSFGGVRDAIVWCAP